MDNPGKKAHSLIAAIPNVMPSRGPQTLNNDPYENPVEALAPTTRENMATPPPPTGVQTPAPASAANGALPKVNPAVEQHRIEMAKMPGNGSTSQNPAWAKAHQTVQDKMQARRAHPLHQGAYDPDRKEFVYDIDTPNYHELDQPPSAESYSAQEFMKLKVPAYDEYKDHELPGEYAPAHHFKWDSPMEHPGYSACAGCFERGNDSEHPNATVHQAYPDDDSLSTPEHQYRPVKDLAPGVRLAAFDHERNEWTYDLDDPGYFENDPAPSKTTGHAGDLARLKFDDPYESVPQFLESDDTVKPGRELFGDEFYRQNDASREEALSRRAYHDRNRNQFVYDIDSGPDYYLRDSPPSVNSNSNQPFLSTRPIYDGGEGPEDMPDLLDDAYHHPSHQVCQGCFDAGLPGSYHPDNLMHQPERSRDMRAHKYQPIDDLPQGVRLAAWDNNSNNKDFISMLDGSALVERSECPGCGHSVTKFRGVDWDEDDTPHDCDDHMQHEAGLRLSHHDPDQDMKDVMAVQGNDGNWNYDPYMHGMFNGMELMHSIAEKRDPEFREAPDEWLAKEAASRPVWRP